jgi:hypothetical protein
MLPLVLAQKKLAPEQVVEWSTSTAALLGIVVAAAVAAAALLGRYVLRQTSKRWEDDPNALLTDFRSLRDRGDMTEEEYRRVRWVLDNKIRRRAGVPESPAEAPPIAPSGEQDSEEFEWTPIDLASLENSPGQTPRDPA